MSVRKLTQMEDCMKIIDNMDDCKRVERGKYADTYANICDKKAVFVAGKPQALRNVMRQWGKRSGNEIVINTVVYGGETGIVVRLASTPEPHGHTPTMAEIFGRPE